MAVVAVFCVRLFGGNKVTERRQTCQFPINHNPAHDDFTLVIGIELLDARGLLEQRVVVLDGISLVMGLKAASPSILCALTRTMLVSWRR